MQCRIMSAELLLFAAKLKIGLIGVEAELWNPLQKDLSNMSNLIYFSESY